MPSSAYRGSQYTTDGTSAMIQRSIRASSPSGLASSRAQTGLQLVRGSDEWDHEMQVLEVAPHFGERAQLEREEIGLAGVPEAAAISDHRVRLRRLMVGASGQVPELVRAKVHRAVDDRAAD